MPWFKVDDQLAFHRKALMAGNAAMGLWVRAGSWAAQQLTDGIIPDDLLSSLGSRYQADRLVKAGLWEREPGGYRFVNWHEWQPTRAEVEKRRADGAERLRQWRAAQEGRKRGLRSIGGPDDQ